MRGRIMTASTVQDAKVAGASEQQSKQQQQPDAQSQGTTHIASQVAEGHGKERQAACNQARAGCAQQHVFERQQLQQAIDKEKAMPHQ